MKRAIALVGIVPALICAVNAWGANSVIVESKTVAAGQVGAKVGVYFTNDIRLTRITLPLEFRSTSGGAFMSGLFEYERTGRFQAVDGFMSCSRRAFPGAQTCSGPVSNTYPGPSSSLDYISPDAVQLEYTWPIGVVPPLPIGSDGEPGSGTPSTHLYFYVGCETGVFEIDTCCFSPDHLNFWSWPDEELVAPLPAFAKGVITVAAQAPPGCVCNYDPVDVNCDGVCNMTDIALLTNVVFRGADPLPPCCK